MFTRSKLTVLRLTAAVIVAVTIAPLVIAGTISGSFNTATTLTQSARSSTSTRLAGQFLTRSLTWRE